MDDEVAALVVDNGSGMCWGSKINGELGDGNTADSNVPVAVSGLSSVKAISTGSGILSGYSCDLLSNQTANCWGENGNGQLGNGSSGTDNATPDNVLNLSTIRLP